MANLGFMEQTFWEARKILTTLPTPNMQMLDTQALPLVDDYYHLHGRLAQRAVVYSHEDATTVPIYDVAQCVRIGKVHGKFKFVVRIDAYI